MVLSLLEDLVVQLVQRVQSHLVVLDLQCHLYHLLTLVDPEDLHYLKFLEFLGVQLVQLVQRVQSHLVVLDLQCHLYHLLTLVVQ